MEEVKEVSSEDKLAEAKSVLETAEKEKQVAFIKEINELSEKHGYILDVVSQIVVKKK